MTIYKVIATIDGSPVTFDVSDYTGGSVLHFTLKLAKNCTKSRLVTFENGKNVEEIGWSR